MNVGDVSPNQLANKNVHVFRSERALRPNSAFSHPPAMDPELILQQQFIQPVPARGPSRFCPHRKGRRPYTIVFEAKIIPASSPDLPLSILRSNVGHHTGSQNMDASERRWNLQV